MSKASAGIMAVHLKGVSRHFGSVVALDRIDLDIQSGEFFTLLGPSGSGKTTCLRLIAGFEQPTNGHIELYGQTMEGIPPYERDVNTVFQDYALFPHMSVGENIAYGLMIKRVPKPQREQRVREMLELVRLPGIASRRPNQLSGGQKQRVALARALINEPRVLLLDEPLGALDLKLRQEMQIELKAIQKRVGITFIFVTHDQEEALTMSDRIAVFNHGRIEQVGTPTEIYDHPRTVFVAGFVGMSNLLDGETARTIIGQPHAVAIRPEKIHMIAPDATPPQGSHQGLGTVEEIIYLGATTRYTVRLESGVSFSVLDIPHTPADSFHPQQGNKVRLWWEPAHTLRLEQEGT